MKQGQGPGTAQKERTFGAALSVGLRVFRGSVASHGFEYVHGDMHAGSGWNAARECDGSPVVFHDLATKLDVPFRAFFADCDAHAISGLRSRELATDSRVTIHHGDNSEMLDALETYIRNTQRKPELAIGSVVVDPNGYFTEKSVPHGRLIDFARRHPRIDLVLNLNITHYRFVLAQRASGTLLRGYSFFPAPKEIPKAFARSDGLIQLREHGAGHRFMTLVLRNLRTGDHARLSLYGLHTSVGQRMLSEARYAGQIPLL